MSVSMRSSLLALSLSFVSISSVFAQVGGYKELSKSDWPWWRGPMYNGVADADPSLVTEWSADANVLWSADLPGRGNSSPIVVGTTIYLTTCNEETGSQTVLAIDRRNGKPLWKTDVFASGAMRKNSRSTGASSTLACDGKQLYGTFANNGGVHVVALTLAGAKVWEQKLCDYQIHQGYGASPALYENLVIAIADTKGGGSIAAYQRATGSLVWKRERPSNPNYPSPIILPIGGKDQLLMTGCDLVTSLDPKTGSTLWEVEGATTECVTSTVTDGVHVYSSGGYPTNHVAAIKADGSKTIAWTNKSRVYVPSMLMKEGYLYAVMDEGIAVCWKSDTGKEMWKQRLGGNFSASPVLVGDRIYAINETGETFVFRASPEKFEKIASNKLGDEAFATPTICGGKIYLRVAVGAGEQRQEKLYCIGKKD